MPTRDARVDAYIARARPFAKPILTKIRKAVHAGCPDVIETIKWSVPAFDHKGPLCGMAAFKAHCVWGFWKAALMKTVPADTAVKAIGGFGRFESVDQLPPERAIIQMVKEAAALNDAGVKVPKVVKAKPAVKAPADMLAAIRKTRRARETYEAFSPSARREYIEWVTGAKSPETRARRLETAVQWMADGKVRNWKYVPAAKAGRAGART